MHVPIDNPHGYCPDHSTGGACPIGLGVEVEVVTNLRREGRRRWGRGKAMTPRPASQPVGVAALGIVAAALVTNRRRPPSV